MSLPLTGFGEDWSRDVEPAVDVAEVLTRWGSLLNKASKWRFNTVRLAFRFPDSPSTPETVVSTLNYTTLDALLDFLSSRGVKAILDLHNYRDMYGWCGSQAWINNWVQMAERYNGDKRIAAFELFNEPFKVTWAPEITSKADLARAFAKCTDSIRLIDPNRMVVWADPRFFQDTSTSLLPSDAVRKNVIYGFHAWVYGAAKEGDVQAALEQAYRVEERMVWWKQKYPEAILWLGEFGVYGGAAYEASKAFCIELINWCVANKVGFSWWLYSSNHHVAGSADSVLEESNYKKLIQPPPSPPTLTGPLGIWTFPILRYLGTFFPNIAVKGETLLKDIMERWKRGFLPKRTSPL